MPRKIIYLINPISGDQANSNLEQLIRQKTREQKIDFDILPTSSAGDYQFLIKKIRQEKVTDVVVCGGDGTVNAVASALRGLEVNIGIIPLGSGNGLAFAAKIPKPIDKALEIVFKGKSGFIDAFEINGQFSCMLCGMGFDASVAHEFAKQKRRGLQTYIKVSALQFFKAKPYPFTIRLKEKTFDTEAFFISIANSNQFGNHVTIAPQASLSDGLLDIVIVKKMSKLMLPFSMINQVTGINHLQYGTDYIKNKHILYFQTASLTIHNPGLAPFHIDGDPFETAAKFTISIIPEGLRLLQP
jgi:diacylglycerol kinase (ATP)